MSELSRLIVRLQKGVVRNASYIKTIKYPQLLIASLQELNELIGNEKVKDAVATQVTHLIMIKRRAIENPNIKEDEVMLNTILYGPPGVGKTLIGTKLAKIWYSLGYLQCPNRENKQEFSDVIKDLIEKNGMGSSNKDLTTISYIIFVFIIVLVTFLSMIWSFYNRFGGVITLIAISVIVFLIIIVGFYISTIFKPKRNNTRNQRMECSKLPPDDQIIKVVTRADFVDKYVGWTDKKTIKLLEENLGKVLFVDEAYSLVTDVHDSFGMEALNAINLFLSQHPREIIVIFAGYKDLMESGIFSFQPGLRRRFMWQFNCTGYDTEQLFNIFKLQLHKKGWGLTDEENTKLLFYKNQDAFPSYGGDTERLTFFAELEHSRDFINNERNMSINKLSPEHVRRGIIKLRENDIQDENSESNNPIVNMMRLLRSIPQIKRDNSTDILLSSIERTYR